MKTRQEKYNEAVAKLEEAKAILDDIATEHQRDYDSCRFSCAVTDILGTEEEPSCGIRHFATTITD